MKKIISLIVASMLLLSMLSACGKQTDNPAETTAPPATGTEVTDATPTTQSRQETSPALTPEEEFYRLINDDQWYCRALGCVFDKPENLPTYFYFHLGVGDSTQATGEEFEFILNAFAEKYPNGWQDYGYEYTRLPVAKINEALSILGVTIEDIEIPSQWAYNKDLDCYYTWVTDAYGVGRWSVTKVEKDADGIVKVYWETDGYISVGGQEEINTGALLEKPKMVLTMQQQPDGTYRILSNVPQS